MRRTVLVAAVLLLAIAVHPNRGAWAEDSRITIEQVPDDKQRGQTARDEGLLPDDVPERCADPEVAVKDPECIQVRDGDDYVSKGYGIPVIKDPSQDGLELIPGVTINQPTSSRIR